MSRHIDLMRLHDGDLSPEEALELERALSAEDREVLAGLDQLGDVVRALESEEIARFEGVADSVMAALEADAAPKNVVPLLPKVEADGELPKSRRQRPRSAPVVVAGLALAVAAAVALWMSTPGPQPSAPAPVAAVPVKPMAPPEASSPAPEPAAELAEDDADPAASIETVDFGNQAGSIFMVPAGAENTPVVWLVDDAVGARMEPL